MVRIYRQLWQPRKLDGLHVEFHKGPMYYGCANEEWYAELVGGPENVEYTVTVVDNNYLELYRYVKGFSHGMVRQLRAVGRPVDRGIATVFHYRRK